MELKWFGRIYQAILVETFSEKYELGEPIQIWFDPFNPKKVDRLSTIWIRPSDRDNHGHIDLLSGILFYPIQGNKINQIIRIGIHSVISASMSGVSALFWQELPGYTNYVK